MTKKTPQPSQPVLPSIREYLPRFNVSKRTRAIYYAFAIALAVGFVLASWQGILVASIAGLVGITLGASAVIDNPPKHLRPSQETDETE